MPPSVHVVTPVCVAVCCFLVQPVCMYRQCAPHGIQAYLVYCMQSMYMYLHLLYVLATHMQRLMELVTLRHVRLLSNPMKKFERSILLLVTALGVRMD